MTLFTVSNDQMHCCCALKFNTMAYVHLFYYCCTLLHLCRIDLSLLF